MAAFSCSSAIRQMDIQAGPPAPRTRRRMSSESAHDFALPQHRDLSRLPNLTFRGHPGEHPSRLMEDENATLEVSASAELPLRQ